MYIINVIYYLSDREEEEDLLFNIQIRIKLKLSDIS